MEAAIVILFAGVALIFYAAKKSASSSKPSFIGPPEFIGPPAPDKAADPIGPTAPANVWTVPELKVLAGEIADEETVSAPLVKAICDVESSWNPRARNDGDRPPSIGLMGLKVPTARAYVPWVESEEDLYDPPTNIRGGARFLKDLWNKHSAQYGLDGVIQMYNLGETRFLNGERSSSYLLRVRNRL
jgi:soluble lytic murein transglycosylase-like protein